MDSAQSRIESPFLTTKQAAEYLGGISPRTLEGYRYRGIGPDHYKLSQRRVYYKKVDLDTWAEKQRVTTRHFDQ